MPKKKTTEIRCPKCQSIQIQTRKTDRMRWCRGCLYEGPMKDFEFIVTLPEAATK